MNCLPQEFVSNYATKSQEEDYAESFAYWYLYNTDGSDGQHGAAPDNPINRRARYFEDLFEEEAERYKDCFEEGFFHLPEGNEASRLLDLPYEPVYVGVVDGSKNPENAALFLKVLLEE
jgi:hypothetical protein